MTIRAVGSTMKMMAEPVELPNGDTLYVAIVNHYTGTHAEGFEELGVTLELGTESGGGGEVGSWPITRSDCMRLGLGFLRAGLSQEHWPPGDDNPLRHP
jgi:hypothetical protein